MSQAQDRNVSPTDLSPRGDRGYRGIHNIPVYARIAIPVLTLFAVVYFGTNWISSRRTGNYQLYFDWELVIPFVPGMIYIYASLLVLLLLPAFLLTRQQIRVLARAMVITLFLAAAIFLLLPTDLGFERPDYVTGYDAVYQALYAIELPHNLVPSLHIASSTLLIAAIHNNTASPWGRMALVVWCVLICASVLLVHQHHVLDVISGLLLGLITYRLVYLR
jgi:membrane-associated phospholipid phosphatase